MLGGQGRSLTLSCGFLKWIVETYTRNAFKAVYSPIQCFVEANVIDDIHDSCLQIGSDSVCYESHEGNSITHFLTKLALSNSYHRVSLDILSKFLDSFVKNDIINLE